MHPRLNTNGSWRDEISSFRVLGKVMMGVGGIGEVGPGSCLSERERLGNLFCAIYRAV